MKHRTRLDKISSDEHTRARKGLAHLQRQSQFDDLVTLLEAELVSERALYEEQTASEFQRGQVVMLKKVLTVLTGDYLNE